ncbi:MAG: tetratricopeptide repeat protein [Bacteroidales bacterium]|nr:tetratricopeptide repeat protein [Bacteroidales bacterium]
MKKVLLIILISLSLVSFAQDSIYSLGLKAIEEGRWLEAEHLFIKAIDKGEDKLKCSYELAWAYYCNKEYPKAIKTLSPFITDTADAALCDVYQLLGNAYDENGQTNKAVSIYDEGLKKYPLAANLYLEKGNIKYKEGEYREALYWYEKGIEADPNFASNYYRAAKVFLMSTEVVWGVLYGEIFMILEPESSRSREFSKELFDAYFECIDTKSGKAETNFNNGVIVYSDSFERKTLFPSVFDKLMTKAAQGKRYLNLASLIQIRKDFLSLLSREEKDFDNPLFKYERELINNGLFEAYNYYLFAYGSTKESSSWINSHKAQWNKLIKYLQSNPIPLDGNHFFSRYNME